LHHCSNEVRRSLNKAVQRLRTLLASTETLAFKGSRLFDYDNREF